LLRTGRGTADLSRLFRLASYAPERNAAHGRQSLGVISAAASRVTVLVVPTHEELVSAREVMRLITAALRAS